jgi:putative ABC transport system ATP-binding protein
MARPVSAPGSDSPAGTDPGLPPDLVTVSEVSRTFGRGEAAVRALRGVSFTVREGQLVVPYGRSGSGKTTMLNITGGLDLPTSGSVHLAGQDVTRMTERERTLFRRNKVAFVFQSFGLIPMLSAAENVGIPLRIAVTEARAREERVRLLLSVVGLTEHAGQRPNELSGGQQQRVAIARALAGSPQLLIADEPTGQLDYETGRQIIRLLRTVVRSEGITALVATHDTELMDLAEMSSGWKTDASSTDVCPKMVGGSIQKPYNAQIVRIAQISQDLIRAGRTVMYSCTTARIYPITSVNLARTSEHP